jgi:hypothetical protein
MIARSLTVVGAGLTAIVAALLPDSWGTRPRLVEAHAPLALPAGWLGDLAQIGGLLGVAAVLAGTLALAKPRAAVGIAPTAATALALGAGFLIAWLADSPGVEFSPAAYVATGALGVAAVAAGALLIPARPRPDPRLEVLYDVITRVEHRA